MFETRQPEAGLIAGEMAVKLCDALRRGRLDSERWFRAVEIYQRKRIGIRPIWETLEIARHLEAAGTPWLMLPKGKHVRLGGGKYGKLLRGSESTETSAVGKEIAKRKHIATAYLAQANLPVPAQRTALKPEQAVEAAQWIGFPVVVKPAEGKMSRCVTVGVQDEAEVVEAFAQAKTISSQVVIESVIEGELYRLLTIGGRFFAASRRLPAQVTGDGQATVRELVERANQQPARRVGRMGLRTPIQLDKEALACLTDQALTPDSRPAAGSRVTLCRIPSLGRGGDAVDATDDIHESIREVAERAATLLGIDVCGVDFITTDPTRPYWETGGAICEVNTRPGFDIHWAVSEGQSRDAARAVAQMLFPIGAPTRSPAIVILREPENSALDREILAAAAETGRRVGLATSDGVRSSARDHLTWAQNHLLAVEAATLDGSLDAVIVGVSPAEVVRLGLGLDHVDLAIVPQGARTAITREACEALSRVSGQRLVSTRYASAVARAVTGESRPAEHDLAGPGWALPAATNLPVPDVAAASSDVTVLMLGDLGFGESYMRGPKVAPLRRRLAMHGHGYSLLRLRELIDSADLVVGNLEVPLAADVDPALRGQKNYLGWSDAEETVAALQEAGFDALSLANNHTLDCGEAGLSETIRRLGHAGIAPFGAGPNLAAAGRPFIRTLRVGPVDRTIVLFGCFEFRQRYEKRFDWYAKPGRPGVNPIAPQSIAREIRRLRDSVPAPIFIAYPHWGVDYDGVQDYQRAYARQLIDAGVDLIVGHGAHVLQSVETVSGRPVVYGLGNGVWNAPGRFAHLSAPPFGLAAALRLRQDGDRMSAALRLYPLMIDNAVTRFQNRPVSPGELPQALGALLPGGLGQAAFLAGLRPAGPPCRGRGRAVARVRGTRAGPRRRLSSGRRRNLGGEQALGLQLRPQPGGRHLGERGDVGAHLVRMRRAGNDRDDRRMAEGKV